MFSIRPFQATDQEFSRDVEINNALWPDDAYTVEDLRHDYDTRGSDYFFQRMMIELDSPAASSKQSGKIIGVSWCGEPDSWSQEPGRYYIGWHVDPAFAQLEYGQNGIAQAVLAYLVKLLKGREPAPKRLTTEWREDKVRRIEFLKAEGFKEAMRSQDCELELTSFNPAPFLNKVEQAKGYGIKIYSLPELKAAYEDWIERMHAMEMDIRPDVPMSGDFTPQSLESYAEMFSFPSFLEAGWFIAVDGDQCVGLTNIWDNKANPNRLHTGFTGVRSSHRRRGIATALKLRAIEFARSQGVIVLIANNEANTPMYQINLKLGYKPKPAWLEFHKDYATTA